DFGFPAPRFSLGNRVWYDLNNNGVWDPAATSATGANEAGIADVTVRIYRDNGNNMFERTTSDTLVATTTTDANGYYLFDGLSAGNYFVWIDELMFRSGAPLLNYYSSQLPLTPLDDDVLAGATDDLDRSDNGVYPTLAVPPPSSPKPAPEVNGVVSPLISLTKNSERIGETDLSLNPAHDDGDLTYRGDKRLDSNSNLTVDFGFYKPMSIGNRVWLDVDGDGLRDVGEPPIPSVTLQLWLETTNDATEDSQYQRSGAPYTVTTDTEGYYLFDNLTPGRYVVVIPGGQAALLGLSSTVDNTGVGVTPITRVDNNDNGIGVADSTNLLRSAVIPLVLDSEPTISATPPETDLDPIRGAGRNGEEDRNSNLTLDFGFTGQLMALGNRVWLDPNNNGIIDTGETGISGVTVSLYRDEVFGTPTTTGVPDGTAIRTTTTDASGYYLFDNLAPGRYLVGLNNADFTGSGPLVGLLGSIGNFATPTPVVAPFTRDDNRDNGREPRNATYGMLSSPVVLVRDQTPSNEAPADSPTVGAGGATINSDLTVDFGLYRPLSIGNQVWLDTNNNGLRDSGESGIPGVAVQLLRDTAGVLTPVLDAALVARTDITDANGYYLFDGLGEGDYVVRVAATNFNGTGALVSLTSSTPSLADNVDLNDNGINAIDLTDIQTNGIRSNTVSLRVNSNAFSDTDVSNNAADGASNGYRGNNSESDANSNLTVDFGFTGATMSLGNRIWFDEGASPRDGIRDVDELGAPAGVTLSLYRDNDGNGLPDGTALATTTTSAGGYYLFDGLAPGRYVVGINASNFTSGALLEGYGSSPDPTTARAADLDSQDYGVDNSSPYLINGILSRSITLQLNTEPNADTDVGPE
ncbi:MAG: SdrD B-like domain-containing protein, partial [Phototrophicaceae bacterium]